MTAECILSWLAQTQMPQLVYYTPVNQLNKETLPQLTHQRLKQPQTIKTKMFLTS